ncbi:aldehyde dehydrogenase (NAD) family protein [Lachnoanaerobaculum saburreum F0468]|uniref:Aldehyde dehydrogenase n=1 Tax=Lachnoanaerobaculum saburreum F0468 TaxID=1095750 RepID=I0R8Y4_9FIRM|nr:aldehyde dehydrogenase [Lachnoanaerobaculum saburreum]EIC96142.1 aldehyde dehydrogenase (NAD) family protein [Lachnoanaerobaculum saburreum F0468]RKW35226.1 MAG: aldehyde dehydrogenase [Lachnospiraceae bacterium]
MDTGKELKNIIKNQRDFFNTNTTKSVEYRLQMLQRLKKIINANEEKILSALYNDLSKSKSEAYMSEVAMVYAELDEALKKVREWSRPQRARGTIGTFPAKNYVFSEPYGIVLIMSPWNYPFNLAIAPLIAAISAGNCAVIKCSKESKYTSNLIKEIINNTFDKKYIYCVDSDIEYNDVIYQKYDYIFFTGSSRVGKIIMRAASENLTPVSLELGGKCPCIVDESANIKIAAKRIVWGKLLNAGQTCVSVDYVAVHNSVKEKLIKCILKEIKSRYHDALNSNTYPRIINEHHYKRLLNLIKVEKNIIGGRADEFSRKIEPTVLPEADFEDEIMKEEIFGPLLPIIEYDDIKKLIRTIKEREKPLACYVFTKYEKTARHIIKSISYGGGCVNDVVIQVSNHYMPFGGVGNSGIGSYHGKYGFDTFSHKKSVVWNETMLDLPIRYAPFNLLKFRILKYILTKFR